MMEQQGAETTHEGLRLCDFIQERLWVILGEWERRVRVFPVAESLGGTVLRDHIPQLLERIAAVVRSNQAGVQETLSELPGKHALARLDEGYDLRTATEELSTLRDTILDLWEQQVASSITVQEVRQLDRAIDDVIAASADRFAQARERTLRALDRVCSAALGTGELDTFLPQLMTVLLETVAAVDSVAILLRDEQDELRVRAAIGLEGELLPGFSLSKGIHALYGVPLTHEGQVIGVAQMGSRTAYAFSDDDKQLLRTMAQRATSLIVQAQLMERVHQSEARLQAILDNAPAAIYVKDTEGRFLLVNRHLEHILHRTRGELIGKSCLDFWPADVGRRLQETDHQVLEKGVAMTVEEVVPEDDGLHTVLSVKFPMSDASGPHAALGGISTDITQRKEAERAQTLLVEAGTVLAQSLDLPTTLRSIASLAVAHLADYCMVDLLGEDGELHRLEVLAKDPERKELMSQTAEYAPRLGSASPVARVFETGRAATADITPEWLDAAAQNATHRAVLEELAPRSAVILPLKARGRMLGVINLASKEPGRMGRPSVVVVAQGLADRAAMAIDNARLYQEAKDAVRVREDVVAIVSHDLRNPLNAISLSASTLIKREELDERTAKAATRIYSAADRAHRLIRDLLDFTQARVGGIPLNPRTVELGELARQVVEEIRSAYPERPLELRRGQGGQLEGDPDRLGQVMANLLGNAVQHSPAGTPVWMAIGGEADAVRFEVHNEGPPIAAEKLPSLFEPFHQGREVGARAGGSLGLGLFISRQIVVAHGGRIEVRSEAEQGTTFTVWLPRRSRS